MPFFVVLIEGTNLAIPGEGGEPPIIGFFTSRVVWSRTKCQAEMAVLKSVRQLWSSGTYAKQPSAGKLVLSVSESGPSTFRQWLSAPRGGHAFFSEGGGNEA